MARSEIITGRRERHGVFELRHSTGASCIVCPDLGFNSLSWTVENEDLFFAPDDVYSTGLAIKAGNPILFPFPNRIRDGRFAAGERVYALPIGDPAKKNAIHGFVFDRPWRVIDQGTNSESVWLTGEFDSRLDAADRRLLWPADYRLRITYRLKAKQLAVEAEVQNPGDVPLPFGLGYHPYFRLARFGGEGAIVWSPADRFWVLDSNLPTGDVSLVDSSRDLRNGKPLRGTVLDDVYTSIATESITRASLTLVAELRSPDRVRVLQVFASTDFRELVVFTPPNGQSICFEPYTCTTDAINLHACGINAGWREIPPRETWRGNVAYCLQNE